ncbi:hypothetical protein HPB50_000731 [Hyalomma asiaticum]|uniref:Uncharacterized protein n=1 Tax=Hyalomma asiaticum TaxID=266040 RepID=A0ACB7SU65_HYAAI|nr:hypothetical protein HPB50_000731 [Hyalomma asiaticum]
MAVNEAEKTQVNELVNDFMRYQLNRRGLQWNTCPPLPRPSKVSLVLRTLGDEFVTKYREEFTQMCGRLDMTPSVAQTAYTDVLNELFSEGITWARIVGAFAFSVELSALCVEKNWSELVDSIASWLSSYVCTRLLPWIKDHQGWADLRVLSPPWRPADAYCSKPAGPFIWQYYVRRTRGVLPYCAASGLFFSRASRDRGQLGRPSEHRNGFSSWQAQRAASSYGPRPIRRRPNPINRRVRLNGGPAVTRPPAMCAHGERGCVARWHVDRSRAAPCKQTPEPAALSAPETRSAFLRARLALCDVRGGVYCGSPRSAHALNGLRIWSWRGSQDDADSQDDAHSDEQGTPLKRHAAQRNARVASRDG